MKACERCAKRGIQSGVTRFVTISDVTDELPDGTLQITNHDAWTTGLCLQCAVDVQRAIEAALAG
jgi:hypothetical protein